VMDRDANGCTVDVQVMSETCFQHDWLRIGGGCVTRGARSFGHQLRGGVSSGGAAEAASLSDYGLAAPLPGVSKALFEPIRTQPARFDTSRLSTYARRGAGAKKPRRPGGLRGPVVEG